MERKARAIASFSAAGRLQRPAFPIEGQSMTGPAASSNWTIRRALSWALVPLLGFALAFWLRYGVIQPQDIGIQCGQPDAPGWCGPREWLILGQHYGVWGWVALIGGSVALVAALPPRLLRIVLAIALVFSALALVLYNTTLGAVALVLTLLALLRQ
jgi:hypothetical protein